MKLHNGRIAKIGLALMLAGAAGYYLENGPRRPSITAASDSEILSLLREPQELPDLEFIDDNGRQTRLSDYRGKVILLNLWATWCQPCRKEMPSLDRLQAILGGTDFEVIALSVDHDFPVVKEFYRQTTLTTLLPYIDRSGQAMPRLAVTAIPTTLVVDRLGREIGRVIGPMEWDSPSLIKQLATRVSAPTEFTDPPGKP